MKKRYKSEAQIIRAIDRTDANLKKTLAEAEEFEYKIRERKLHGGTPADMYQLDVFREEQARCRRRAVRQGQRLAALGRKLAEFRTAPMTEITGAEHSIPQRL